MSNKTEIARLEAEIKERQAKIHKLKGAEIRLCGQCYGTATPKHSCYSVKINGRTDISVYLSEWLEYKPGYWAHRDKPKYDNI